MGEPGIDGDPGPQGDPGPEGDKGDTGETGPSGVVEVLSFVDVDFGDELDTPDTVKSPIEYPATCQTTAYTAGPGEVAVMNIAISLVPLGTISDSTFLGTPTFDDGGGFEDGALYGMYDGVVNGVGSGAAVSANRVIDLTDGVTYTFGVGVGVSTGAPAIPGLGGNRARCSGTVMIVRQ